MLNPIHMHLGWIFLWIYLQDYRSSSYDAYMLVGQITKTSPYYSTMKGDNQFLGLACLIESCMEITMD